MAKDGFGNIVSDENVGDLVKDILRSGLLPSTKAGKELTPAQIEEQVRDEFYSIMVTLDKLSLGTQQAHMDNLQRILRTYESPNFERFLRTGQAGKALEELQIYRRTHNLY